jgi:gamma-glutamyltranspeptidase/glutathione hydrolase
MHRCTVWLTLGASLTALTISGCASRPIAAADGERTIYRSAAVAADHPLASQAGLEMLQKGGNAVDAAVATSFCLSVVRPFSCGIGGGGFMMIWIPSAQAGEPGSAIAINYREACPAAVGPDFYASLDDNEASKYGWRASGVPGTVAGLCHALKEYGTLDLKTVLGPAIRAAEEGFEADAAFVDAVRSVARTLETRPDLREGLGTIWKDVCREGEVCGGVVIRNPDQARALRLIAEHGPSAFYESEIARAIDATMREHAGTLTLDDLGSYLRRFQDRRDARPTFPVRVRFRALGGCEIISMPPPSSGGIAIGQIFGVLERRSETFEAAHNSADYLHLVAEAMKHAFADRAAYLADIDFVPVPVEDMLSSWYLEQMTSRIDMQHTRKTNDYGSAPLPDDHGTSHLCVLDANGMAVACTETINLEFGSLVCVPGFGFALNNEMDDFTTIPGHANAFGLRQSDANLPEPGKRPLSSMSPTIVVKDGKVVMIAGASGGPRIISATTQCMLNVMLFGMTPEQAVRAPRFHHQWMPNVLQVDRTWRDQGVLEELKRRGHEIGTLDGEAVVQMIAVDERDGTIRAACDPRKGGKPAGY